MSILARANEKMSSNTDIDAIVNSLTLEEKVFAHLSQSHLMFDLTLLRRSLFWWARTFLRQWRSLAREFRQSRYIDTLITLDTELTLSYRQQTAQMESAQPPQT